jgi:hypothetical protein
MGGRNFRRTLAYVLSLFDSLGFSDYLRSELFDSGLKVSLRVRCEVVQNDKSFKSH